MQLCFFSVISSVATNSFIRLLNRVKSRWVCSASFSWYQLEGHVDALPNSYWLIPWLGSKAPGRRWACSGLDRLAVQRCTGAYMCLISITGVKHLPAVLAKNFSDESNFLHGFGRTHSDLQLCFVQLKTLAPSVRYSTCKYTVTLKPGSKVTQGHRKWYQSIQHPRLPINVP